jgi:hypothetical protein
LIAKLLAQMSKEQEESYIEERIIQCKTLDFKTRQSKANQLELQLKLSNEIAVNMKKVKSKDVEIERRQ